MKKPVARNRDDQCKENGLSTGFSSETKEKLLDNLFSFNWSTPLSVTRHLIYGKGDINLQKFAF